MRSYQAVIRLSAEEREELTRWAKSRTLPAGDVFKASLILALADGKSYSAVEAELNTSRPTIARWRARFEQARIAGLESHHRGSRPRQATPAVQARILKKTQQKPADGSTHWSCRKMAAAVGVSPATVHRIWAKAGLKPHRLDRYMASNDPAFEQKAAEIIALYMDPPQHAAVFCVDEKTAIQALDRLDPVLPLSPGRAEKHGFEYYRHGTLSLYAALDVKTGQVHGKSPIVTPAPTSSSFWLTSWSGIRAARKFTSCSTTCRLIKPKPSRSSSTRTRRSGFTSPQPTRRG
jgi:transposase